MFGKRAILGAAALLGVMSYAVPSQASLLGEIWINDPNPGNASLVPAGTADATFNPGAINYQSPPSAYTVGAFLNNPIFNNQSAAFIAAGGAASTANNIFLRITGTVALNAGANSFVVGHDDGVVLSIAPFGTVVNAPGPTSFSTSPFTVTAPSAGDYSFTLLYAECCGGPADLVWSINSSVVGGVPEPSTWAMMILGFCGLGLMAYRRRGNALRLA
jgi:hypothetical protein